VSIPELISADQLRARIKELGAELTELYAGETIVCIGVLKGSALFLADLIREIDTPLEIDFLGVSSYQGTTSSGVVRITHDLRSSIEGRNVLIVEDIVDTGLTLSYLLRNLSSRNPKSLRVATLLDKPSRRKVEVPIDYAGFQIPDEFVIGYGLDLDELYRNLPYIGIYQGE
jgi:hypoxanthine phosphoribosyltransferase